MSMYITIDGGTTNTRINLVKDKNIIDAIKLGIGAKASIENQELLKTEIKSAIAKLLKQNNVQESDIVKILASGMITSEFGLCNLVHINTPAGIGELHNSMHEIILQDISSIPFVFIRGVKNVTDSIESTDIMRGEETELMGIINPEYGKCVYILPGSHSKIIEIDEKGRICNFFTMLTGEMIAALSSYTILKDAVDLNKSKINSKYLLKGYDCAEKEGINKALFKTRVLKNVFGCDKNETYSFFIGVILFGEVDSVIKCNTETVVVGGKSQIKSAMVEILKNRSHKKVIALDEDIVDMSTSIGAVRIFEN